jgi:hypothetical protein
MAHSVEEDDLLPRRQFYSIPGQVEAPDSSRRQHVYRLDTAQPGTPVAVWAMTEVAEDEQALIILLHGKGLTPGTALVVVECAAEGGYAALVNGSRVHVAGDVAHMVWVRAVEP